MNLAGRMWPTGRVFETPGVKYQNRKTYIAGLPNSIELVRIVFFQWDFPLVYNENKVCQVLPTKVFFFPQEIMALHRGCKTGVSNLVLTYFQWYMRNHKGAGQIFISLIFTLSSGMKMTPRNSLCHASFFQAVRKEKKVENHWFSLLLLGGKTILYVQLKN
jgi:hypothetical protein